MGGGRLPSRRRPRFVGQAAALTALATVLTAVASSSPLFIQSAGEGAWRQDRARLSEVVLGATILTGNIVQSDGRLTVPERVGRVPDLDARIRDEGADLGLQPPLALTALFDPVGAAGLAAPVQVISRDGADAALRIVAGGSTSDGALVPASAAQALDVGPGDSLVLRSENGVAEVVVSGVYEDLTAPLPVYWQGQDDLFLPRTDSSGGGVRPAPAALVMSRAAAVRLAQDLSMPLRLNWFFPLPADERLATARRQAELVEALTLRLTAPERPAAALLEQIASTPTVRSALPVVLDAVDETVVLLAPPVRAVGAGGAAAALALVGAWAGLRARKREAELRSLVARGLSPARAAWTALAEAAVPVIAGSAAGVALGLLGVRLLGPVDAVLLDRAALWWAAGAALAGACTVAAVTASATARLGQVGVGAARQAMRRVPLVPVLTAVAVVAALPLLRPAEDVSGQQVGLLTLAVPLLAVVAGSAVAVGLLQRLAPRLRPRLDRLPVGLMLTFRRVLATPGATKLVVVSTALSLGLVVYAGALGASTDRTVSVKAVVATGSDVVVDLDNARMLPQAPVGTTVVRHDRDVEVLPGGSGASLLAVDPDRFGDVAFWTPELADMPLETLLAALESYDGTRVPVIVAGPLPAAVVSATDGELTIDSPKYQVPVQVVGRADAWPGMSSTKPLLIAAQQALATALLDAEREMALVTTAQAWGRGSPDQVRASLGEAGFGVPGEDQVRTAAAFQDRPALRAQTWTLGYLRAVAAAAGLLGLVGLGLHAASQQRRRTVATVLLTRMGLTARSARRSAAAELALLGGVAALFGAALTLPAAWLLLGRLDPVPDLLPGPLFAVPVRSLAALAVGVVVAAVAGAAVVDRMARRIPGGEVLRGGE